MRIRRLTTWLISLAMLQFATANRAICELHEPPGDVAAEPSHGHHAAHDEPGLDTPEPDCDPHGQADCCVAVASCTIVLGAPGEPGVPIASLTHLAVAVPRATRLLSVVTAPEPPPPRA